VTAFGIAYTADGVVTTAEEEANKIDNNEKEEI
jgi:hypothetical protein